MQWVASSHSSVAYATIVPVVRTGTWFALSFRSAGGMCRSDSSACLSLSYLVQEYLFHLKSTTDFKQSNLSRLIPAILSTVLQWHSSSGNFEWSHLWFVIHLSSFHWLPTTLSAFERGRAHLLSKLSVGMENLSNLSLAAIEGALRSRWPGYQNLYDDWANSVYTFCILSTATS